MPFTLKNIKKQEKFHLDNPSKNIVGECSICKHPLSMWDWYGKDTFYCLYHYAQLPYDVRERLKELRTNDGFINKLQGTFISRVRWLVKSELSGTSEWISADLPQEVKDYCEAQLAAR